MTELIEGLAVGSLQGCTLIMKCEWPVAPRVLSASPCSEHLIVNVSAQRENTDTASRDKPRFHSSETSFDRFRRNFESE